MKRLATVTLLLLLVSGILIQGCGPSQEELRIGALEHFKRGNSLFTSNDPSGAISEYRMAIALDDSQAVFHFNMGLAYYRLVLYEQSIDAYQTAVRLNPNFGEAWYNLSLALDKIGETDKAFMAYERYQTISKLKANPRPIPAGEKPMDMKNNGKADKQ